VSKNISKETADSSTTEFSFSDKVQSFEEVKEWP